jgi:DNA-binding GntR family transcriptional regulator
VSQQARPRKPAEKAALVTESPAARQLLKDRAYSELKALIHAGDITPESTLSERQLAERLGMSKTPVRAALENLETQGLVTVSPQRGIFVRDLSARETAELFDVRSAVEPFIAGQLARNSLTPQQREWLTSNLQQQQRAATVEDAQEATRLDIALHRLLAELLDNRELMNWLERCFDRLYCSVLRVNRLARNRLLKSYQEHEGIVTAVLEGRHDEAPRRMTEHLVFGRHFLLLGDLNSGADRA